MSQFNFTYGTMTSGKTTVLLQAAHNFKMHGLNPYLLTAERDTRSGVGMIKSRIGIEAEAHTYQPGEDLYNKIYRAFSASPMICVLIDEAQWLSKTQVWQLSDIVDNLGIDVYAYGLRTDFKGDLFEGSAALMAIADEMTEIKAICSTGQKATMVARLDAGGNIVTSGPQIQVGGEESYVPMSRRAWKTAMQDAVVAIPQDKRVLTA